MIPVTINMRHRWILIRTVLVDRNIPPGEPRPHCRVAFNSDWEGVGACG
jgi:hypothetical protein